MASHTVYAVASGKGGVGKTTTTVNVGTALAGAGNTVAVVDTDMGMANLAGLVSLSPDATTLHEVLAGEASVEEASYELADGIVAVPSGADLESYADADARGLGDVVDRLREEFDYVLLDVGAGISHESVLPLGLADEVVLVTTPEPASVQDASKTADLTERADGRVAGLVINRVRDDRNFDFEGIAERVGVPLLGTVPEDDAVRDSVYTGTPVVVDAPESPAATAYRRLAERLVSDGDPGAAADADTDADDGDADAAASDEADADDASHSEVSSAIEDVDDGEAEIPDEGDSEDSPAADATASDADDAEGDASAATSEPAAEADDSTEASDDATGAADAAGGDESAARDPTDDPDDPAEGDGVTIPDAEGGDDADADADEADGDGISFDEDGEAVPFSDRSPPGADDADDADGDEDDDEDEDEDGGGGLLGGLLG
nr:MinD/ParA family protein [Halostella litorea]